MMLLFRSEEIILFAVYKPQGNAYGVTTRKKVNKDLGRYWPFGVIYKTLKKLKAKGYVDKTVSDPVSDFGEFPAISKKSIYISAHMNQNIAQNSGTGFGFWSRFRG